MSTLETYVCPGREIVAGGKTLQLLPLRVRQIPAFAAALAESGDLAGLLAEGMPLQALARHGDALARLVVIATGESPDWVGDLLPDDFIGLAVAVFEVNADFFVGRVQPAMTEAALQVAKTLAKLPTPGATPSPS